MTAPIRRIGVVVPAHNEESVVGRCLVAIGEAARRVQVPVTTLVVLDDCRDRTETICRSFPVNILDVQARSVGVARHAGVRALLSGVTDAESIWIANTDADSVVSPTWLRDQMNLADDGVDVVVGTVDLTDQGDAISDRFVDLYESGLTARGEHTHVHGANLGLRASSYLAVGGFPPVRLHEDRSLLARLSASDAAIVRSSRIRVATSARLRGRCDGGFASVLERLSVAS